ncbi:hypothetical protein OXX59_000485 [Metschnikowia pulcherrima]
MVLLNGIKYACERCIRGHRVSSCTHTDKTLVMIKPKGRPASQCSHCREQRKVKNSHTSCECAKRGKSPGQHFASCLCFKNAHCTCVAKEKKSPLPRKKRSPEIPASDSGDASQSEASQVTSDISRPPLPVSVATQDSDFLIEDIALPFETESGLLDYFSSSVSNANETPEEQFATNGQFQPEPNYDSTQMSHSNSAVEARSQPQNHYTENQRDPSYFPNPPTDADLDLMENMFPLFPLVGFNSFEDDKSLPLSGLPSGSTPGNNPPFLDRAQDQNCMQHSPSINANAKAERPSLTMERNRSESVQPVGAFIHSNSSLNQQSSVSLTNINAGATHHPRPLKASSSFSVSQQNNRPKRSESVMSTASTSSNTSKHNYFEASSANQHHFPKSANSAAFPPFNLLDNNSTDDFHQPNFNSPGLFNENISLPILSDEELPRAGQLSGNITPQSSVPSRQLSQSRRKVSLSRSHSQLHHNTVSKDHPLFPMKAGSSSENSPRPLYDRNFNNNDDSLAHKTNDLDGYLLEVAEEPSAMQESEMKFFQAQQPITAGIPVRDSPVPPFNDDFNIENPEFSLIPMYSEIFEPMQNGV